MNFHVIRKNHRGVKKNGVGHFLSGADAWVIAQAKVEGAIVVNLRK